MQPGRGGDWTVIDGPDGGYRPSERGLRLIGHHDLGGRGDGMQVMRWGSAVYVGHVGTSRAGTSVLDASDPERLRLVEQWPAPNRSHTHKVQVADDVLLVNHEKFPYRVPADGPVSAGVAIYDVSRPLEPRRIAFWECGGIGVHRIVWTGGRYAHMSATPAGFRDRIWIVLDLADPFHPVEAARWWWPGQRDDEVPDWPAELRYAAHHALIADGRAFVGYGDAGMVILDVADITRPRLLHRVSWPDGGDTHTCLPLPGRRLIAVTDEQVRDGPGAPPRKIRLFTMDDPPRLVSVLPAPDDEFASLPLRYGAHNLHENRPRSYQSEDILFATYFSAGLRVYDISDPGQPVEIAHWCPPVPPGQAVPQINDVFVDHEGLIWVTDRLNGGLYVLEPEPELRRRMLHHAPPTRSGGPRGW